MATWHGVMYVTGNPAMPLATWGLFTDEVYKVLGIGRDSHQQTSFRGNLIKVKVRTEERLDDEGEPVMVDVYRSTEYFVVANFNRTIINPEVIKNWLLDIVPNVNPVLLTYELGDITVSSRKTVYADYSYNGAFMLRIAFMGLANRNTSCTYEESLEEARAWMALHPENWETSE